MKCFSRIRTINMCCLLLIEGHFRMHPYQEQRYSVNVTHTFRFSVAVEHDGMKNVKGQASLFILGRAVWPTFDTYCDIIIGLYCIVYANVLVWGLGMVGVGLGGVGGVCGLGALVCGGFAFWVWVWNMLGDDCWLFLVVGDGWWC